MNDKNCELQTLVYITGTGRSGSTLLDMLLNQHPRIAALGEVHRFSMSINRKTKPHRCTCGSEIAECEFWSAVIDSLGSELEGLITTKSENKLLADDQSGNNIVELIPGSTVFQKLDYFNLLLIFKSKVLVSLLARFLKKVYEGRKIYLDSWKLYSHVSIAHNMPVVVDGTKTPGRFMGLNLFNAEKKKMKVVYLCRDGRAVTLARMGRQNISMKEAAKIWKAEHKKIQIALKRYPSPVLIIKYEDLCNKTEDALSNVLGFIGVDETIADKGFRNSSHSLGGNPMRWRTSEKEIVLNESWKDQLSVSDRDIFESIAGQMNRSLGYCD